jgi:hypothetical protein
MARRISTQAAERNDDTAPKKISLGFRCSHGEGRADPSGEVMLFPPVYGVGGYSVGYKQIGREEILSLPALSYR